MIRGYRYVDDLPPEGPVVVKMEDGQPVFLIWRGLSRHERTEAVREAKRLLGTDRRDLVLVPAALFAAGAAEAAHRHPGIPAAASAVVAAGTAAGLALVASAVPHPAGEPQSTPPAATTTATVPPPPRTDRPRREVAARTTPQHEAGSPAAVLAAHTRLALPSGPSSSRGPSPPPVTITPTQPVTTPPGTTPPGHQVQCIVKIGLLGIRVRVCAS